jgi:hypothetical protein
VGGAYSTNGEKAEYNIEMDLGEMDCGVILINLVRRGMNSELL